MKLLWLYFLLFPLGMCAQVFEERAPQLTWDDFVDEYLAVLDAESEESELLFRRKYALLDEMRSLVEQPVNLNTADRESLRKLCFLSESQIDSLLSRRARLRMFSSLGDLMSVHGLDYNHRRWLSLFVCVGDTAITATAAQKKWWLGRHTLEMRIDKPLYRRKGFRPADRDELLHKRTRFFVGPNLGSGLRYTYNRHRRLRWGLAAENDVGEPFASHGNRPFDHFTGYVYRSGSRSWNWLVGDYKLHYAGGLLFGNGFYASPLSEMDGVGGYRSRFSPNSWTGESRFLRGGLIQRRLSRIDISVFVSHLAWDARTEDDTVQTLYATGLHRSLDEIDRRRTLPVSTLGLRSEWTKGRLSVGATAYALSYGAVVRSSRPGAASARAAHGASGLSVDFSRRGSDLDLSAECAVDGDFNVDFTTGARWHRSDVWRTWISLRFLSPNFNAPYAHTIQQGSRAQNEWGISLAGIYLGWRHWTWRAYVDLFRHPKPTFRAAAPSNGAELGAEIQWRRNKWTHLWRYRLKSKQQTISGHTPRLEYSTTQRLRWQMGRDWSIFAVRVALDAAEHHTQTHPRPEWGLYFLLEQRGHRLRRSEFLRSSDSFPRRTIPLVSSPTNRNCAAAVLFPCFMVAAPPLPPSFVGNRPSAGRPNFAMPPVIFSIAITSDRACKA